MSKLYLATNEDVGDKSLVESLIDKGFDDTPMSKIIDDIGLAIQNKEGTTDYIPASEMAERIANLPSGGGVPSGENIGDILVWDGTVWTAQKPSKLPIGYREVEYIESTGTQYIDTQIKVNTLSKLYLDWKFDTLEGSTIGTYNNVNSWYIGIYEGNWIYNSSLNTYANITSWSTNRTKTEIDLTNKRVCSDNVPYSFDNNAHIPSVADNFFLFARNNITNSTIQYRSHKLYKAEFYNAMGRIIADFIPCYRKSDNEIGLYDLVTNTFFTNQGTGTFLKGAEI